MPANMKAELVAEIIKKSKKSAGRYQQAAFTIVILRPGTLRAIQQNRIFTIKMVLQRTGCTQPIWAPVICPRFTALVNRA